MNEPAGTTTLMVSEVFGPTWQGEGPSLGARAGFVRLGRCNLACTWCDTPYTWRWDDHDPAVELKRMAVDDVAAQLQAMNVPLVVITGGEPLLQQSHVVPLLESLRRSGHRIEVETAGTIAPRAEITALVDRFNVSPKLENSGNPRDQRFKPAVLRAFVETRRAVFKFVVASAADLDEVAAIVSECGIDDQSVWAMPEGVDPATILARGNALADSVLARGWNMTTRLHVLLWGNERGR